MMKEYLMRSGQREDAGQLDRLCDKLQQTSTREEVNTYIFSPGHVFENTYLLDAKPLFMHIFKNCFIFIRWMPLTICWQTLPV